MAEVAAILPLVSSIVAAMAVGYFAWLILSIATSPRIIAPELGRFEERRRDGIRAASWTYRTFEPWIDEMAANIEGRNAKRDKQLEDDLAASANPAPWKPAELIAVWRIESAAAAAATAILGWLFGGLILAVIFGGISFFVCRDSLARGLRGQASDRRKAVRRHLANAIDLLALMIEVGGGFQESLVTVASKLQGTPLGDELSRVLRDIDGGRPRKDALESFGKRLSDTDVDEFVFAIVQGEELGTPLSGVLRDQSHKINQKRSQWAEKESEEAQVNLVFPAMVIMVACLIIVATPFILSALFA
jgi:tight adherence protein C